MTVTTDAAASAKTPTELPSAESIRDIIEGNKKEKAAEEQKHRAAAKDEKKHQEELFLTRTLTPDFIDRIMKRIRIAAESGALEIMIGQFPSSWCSDDGRKINNQPDDSWPDTLQGVAREFYDFWEHNLKPKGFGLRAEIISYPDGKPGDVGTFLSWAAQAGS
jgi:hypothetical protein